MLDVKVSIEPRRDRGKREHLINATAHLIPSSVAGGIVLANPRVGNIFL